MATYADKEIQVMLTRFQWSSCIRSPDPVVVAKQRGACLELLVRNVRPVQDLEGIEGLHWVCGCEDRWFYWGGPVSSFCPQTSGVFLKI